MSTQRSRVVHWLVSTAVGALVPLAFAFASGGAVTYSITYVAVLAASAAATALLVPRRHEPILEFAGEIALFLGVAQVVVAFLVYPGRVDAQAMIAVPLTMVLIAVVAIAALAGAWIQRLVQRRRQQS
jgi:peptidoglycan/LPS O-acetylase OafA/YrhL